MRSTMRRTLEARGSTLLITLEGDFANSAQKFNEHLREEEPLLHDDAFGQFDRVVFDLSGVTHMSSSGVGILLTLMDMTKKAGHVRSIVIAGASERVEKVLATVQISSMFEHFDDLSDVPGVKQL